MTRKILKIEGLEAKYSGIKGYRVIVPLSVKDLKTLWCKLMIPCDLHHANRQHTSQTIVKERLTRKVFRNDG
jgi:hypothetical protein